MSDAGVSLLCVRLHYGYQQTLKFTNIIRNRVYPLLIEGECDRLVAGNRDAHDRLVAEGLKSPARSTEVVVLAQALVAGGSALPTPLQARFLTSPRLVTEEVGAISQTTKVERRN